MEFPKQYDFQEVEKKWIKYWEENGIFKFDKHSKKPFYSVDTPPPTVSGNMHIGHAFSYSQQDITVRFWRQYGYNVLHPFGTDDNGLPTERLVEKLKKVKSVRMDKQEFIELCNTTIKEIKPDFIQDWKNIGMSCDWDTTYSTIDPHCIKTSQKSFLDLHVKKKLYQKEAPSIWCVTCQTAVAQAELEDAQLNSHFSDIQFTSGDEKIVIATTRPELLPACVCIFVHSTDDRYRHLVGKKAKVPLFGQEVPIFADESADPEKGSGILMVCSYGDKFDVDAIQRFKLEPRVVFTKDGKLNYLGGDYQGISIKDARKQILNDLEEKGLLLSKKQIEHTVNVHDKCGTEIEFLSTKQWFVDVISNKKQLIEAGKKIRWNPEYMKTRYDHWVEGLQWDWCISRQRHFGVPFPVWYCKKCHQVKLASEEQLPVYPEKSSPVTPCDCGKNDFIPEMDVMDTWQTSSMSPQIVLDWAEDGGSDLKMESFPMSLRPQAHDIIRTWAFYTITKGIFHEEKIPWQNIMISGHLQDSKGRKMAKSLGNGIDPRAILDKYGADAFRFMAAGSKLGEDFPFQEKDLLTGRKTVTKLWNASKFVMMHLENFNGEKVEELEIVDKWLLDRLSKSLKIYSDSFKRYDYAKAKFEIENFFWNTFCDNYLELIKDRLYNPDKRGDEGKKSAQYTLYVALSSILKMFAPIMPFITEEIYSYYFAREEKKECISLSDWPEIKMEDENAFKIGEKLVECMISVRREKSSANKSLKEPVTLLECDSSLEVAEGDLKAVTGAVTVKYGTNFKVSF